MGLSRSDTAATEHFGWTTWARRSNGTLIWKSYRAGRHYWVDPNPYPTPNAVVHPNGVAATGFVRAGTVYERGIYASNALPQFIEYRLVNGSHGGNMWAHGTPGGRTPTGHVAVSHRMNPDGMSTVLLYATFTDGTLWADKIDGWGVQPDSWVQLAANMSISRPLAASESPDELYSRVFATTQANAVITSHFDGTSFSTASNFGKPAANVDVCATAAAAEGWLDQTMYRAYIFCTATGTGTNHEDLQYAYATSASSDTFIWQPAKDLGAGVSALTSGYAIAARARPDGGKSTIDVYLLDASTTSTKLLHASHEAFAPALGSVSVLSADPETSRRFGGLVTASQPGDYADLFYVGRMDAADLLYRQRGDGTATGATPWNFTNHQSAEPIADIVPAGGEAESSTAFFQGRAINVATLNSPNNKQEVARWSDDDGATWGAPFLLPTNGHTFVNDPTVAFADSGEAYVSLYGVTRVNCNATLTTTSSSIYWVKRRTDGTYTNPAVLATANHAQMISQFDHPWVSVERRVGLNDRVHFIWTDRGNPRGTNADDVIQYASSVFEAFAPAPLHNNAAQGNPVINHLGTAAVVTTGAQGATWVAWKTGICRINATFDGCATVADPIDDANQSEQPSPLQYFGPTGPSLRGIQFRSFVASPSDPNKLYYAFQRLEDDAAGTTNETDLFFAVVTYDPAQNTLTFSPRVKVVAELPFDDDSSQFFPELTVSTGEAVGDLIQVVWYDTRGTYADAGCNSLPNRCYRPRRAVSLDGGLSFEDSTLIGLPPDGVLTPSDPSLLPGECGGATPFLGDYNATTGDVLHSGGVVVVAPAGGPAQTSRLIRTWVSRGYWDWGSP